MREFGFGMIIFAIGAAFCLAVFGGAWYAYKNVQVWSASMVSGEAVLAEAKYSRQGSAFIRCRRARIDRNGLGA